MDNPSLIFSPLAATVSGASTFTSYRCFGKSANPDPASASRSAKLIRHRTVQHEQSDAEKCDAEQRRDHRDQYGDDEDVLVRLLMCQPHDHQHGDHRAAV